MPLYTFAQHIVKKFPRLRFFAKIVINLKRKIVYFLRTLHICPNEKILFFCAYDGRGYACSPKAIYEYCLTAPEFAEYRFIWAFREPEEFSCISENPNTTVVRFGTAAYEKALAGAKYWVFNFHVQEHIHPRGDQTYLQCWHGTPLKRLGFDIEADEKHSMNTLREIQHRYRNEAEKMTYLLSPSPFASMCFRSAWQLTQQGKQGILLELGYPRNDFLHQCQQEDITRVKEKMGLAGETRKIILYAPTWRENQHQSGLGYTYQSAVDFGLLQETLGQDYILLYRTHYLVAGQAKLAQYQDFVYDVSHYGDINDLYCIADMLITDYSSVFFDYALLERPIVFYMYDQTEYQDELRGFYLDLQELPGPIVTTQAALLDAIRALGEGFRVDAGYTQYLKRFNPRDDGYAAQRVAQTVFIPRGMKEQTKKGVSV